MTRSRAKKNDAPPPPVKKKVKGGSSSLSAAEDKNATNEGIDHIVAITTKKRTSSKAVVSKDSAKAEVGVSVRL